MRVTIKREEQAVGLFRNKVHFIVAFQIVMTDEEIATAKHNGIADSQLYCLEDRDPSAVYLVRHAFKGQETAVPFPTLVGANEFEEYFKQQLVNFKSHLEAAPGHGRVETFEL